MRRFLVVAVIMLVAWGCAPPERTKVPNLVWPRPPAKPRIKLIGIYKNTFDVKPPGTADVLVGSLTTVELQRPGSAVGDMEGNIYVSDLRLLQLVKFDVVNQKVILTSGKGPTKLVFPFDLAIDDDRDLLFVVDQGPDVVYVMDKDTFVIKKAIGQGEFKKAVSVAVDPERQRVYVTDTKIHKLVAFDYSGKKLWEVGTGRRDSGPGGFNSPASVAVDSRGNVYVADTFNRYVKIYSPEGEFIKKIGYGPGTGMGNFSKVNGVALDSEDHIYALDIDFCNVQIFDQDNNLLLFWGGPGNRPGQFLLPLDIYIDPKDRIYVADQLNRRVQVFQYISYRDSEKK